MADRHSYVIVADLPGAGARQVGYGHRHRRPGRHRLGPTGGAGHRPPSPRPRAGRRPWPLRRQRARHRPAISPAAAVRYGGLAALAGALAASSWFTISGATALAQMIQP